MKKAIIFIVLGIFVFICLPIQAAPINVTYTVTDANRTPISKYVYGSNWGGGTDYTIRRSGGNRLTAYNWENNYSNAGSDYGPYHNDDYMSSSTLPGKAITDFHDQALSQGQASIVTLQMAGYVAADINGNVNIFTESAPSARFKKVVFAKGAAFEDPPNTSDANVYMDEFVNFLVSTYGHAGTYTGVKFYDLDNEPDIWFDFNSPSCPDCWATHPEVHWYVKPGCAEYKDKSVALSLAVKNVDPNAQMLGPVSYGFGGYQTFQGAPDWTSTYQYQYSWFLDYYLDKMEANSVVAGKRLLDALDVHWYPEAYDGSPFTYSNGSTHRILDNISTNAMYNARMQAPRTLWDATYVGTNGENSWVNQWGSSHLPLIPKLMSDIKTYYPDTNLAFTEYAYGPETHWSTGIATADVLGIFGKYGVYIATYWGNGTYVDAAIKIYRNYNGAHSTFGDMNVLTTISNKVDSSIYGSVSSSDSNVMHLIVLNKNQTDDITGAFTVTSGRNFTSARVFAFDNNSSNITERASISNIVNNTFTYTIPKTSVCHIVLNSPACPVYELTGDCHVGYDDIAALVGTVDFSLWLYQLSPDEIEPCSSDPLCPDLNHDGVIDLIDFALLASQWGL